MASGAPINKTGKYDIVKKVVSFVPYKTEYQVSYSPDFAFH
jgi:hypothetical protein